VVDQAVGLEDIMPTVLSMTGIDLPDTIEGSNLSPLMRGKQIDWRSHLHIEHAPIHHTLTDGREKYIWFVKDGSEQFFHLSEDPDELHDLAASPEHADRVAHWRSLLVQELADRPEGFSDGTSLVPGRPYSPVCPPKA